MNNLLFMISDVQCTQVTAVSACQCYVIHGHFSGVSAGMICEINAYSCAL